MSKRTLGIVVMVVGVVAVIVSLGADALGIGGHAGLELKQALGAVVGVIIVGAGALVLAGIPAVEDDGRGGGVGAGGLSDPTEASGPRSGSDGPAAKKASRSARKGTARGSKGRRNK